MFILISYSFEDLKIHFLLFCLPSLSFLREYLMCPGIKSVTPGSFKKQGIHPWMFAQIFKAAGPFYRRILGTTANPYKGQGELALLPAWLSRCQLRLLLATNAPGLECQVLGEALRERENNNKAQKRSKAGNGRC